MELTDIFMSNLFSTTSLTTTVNEMPYVPGNLGGMGIFAESGVTTLTVAIEKKGNTLSLIQTSPRGAPAEERVRAKRDMRDLRTSHLVKNVTIFADQVQGVRSFGGGPGDLETVEAVFRQEAGLVLSEMDMTLENMRLGAVKGVITDADGSTIYNLFTEFGVSQLSEFDFELDDAAIDVRAKCMQLRRLMTKELKMGNSMPGFKIHAVCSDEFFDGIISHASVKTAWERWQQGEALRTDYTYQQFEHGGIVFENYQTSDDDTVGVTANKAHFFPSNVPGLFKTVYSPADRVTTVNTLGLPRYAFPRMDDDQNPRWIGAELQSNPLCFCTRPRTLIKAKHH